MTRLVAILAQAAVALTWTPSTTPNATTNVIRNGAVIASGLTTAGYTDSKVSPGSFYSYYVTATANGVTSQRSNVITVTIPATSSGQKWTCTYTVTLNGTTLTTSTPTCR